MFANQMRNLEKHPCTENKGCFNVPFRAQAEMTADRILAIWEMLTQSNEDLELDERLDMGPRFLLLFHGLVDRTKIPRTGVCSKSHFPRKHFSQRLKSFRNHP